MQNNDIYNELHTNFIEYAYAVNSDRAIPSAADGLKPVAKRILYSCLDKGRSFSKPHVKAARIVGDVMSELHPHGDSSIYGAMTRLSQNWIMRYPLIDWHGNNGNIVGDGPAAARYTEARLAKISEDGLLEGIKKNSVDFIPNYDETSEEPVVLPSIFPNLLCNPNSGIGVALACSWAPHNLREVAKAINDYIDGKEPMLPGPDFPTGGLVINKDDIPNIMRTGHGSVKIRAKYKFEKPHNIVYYEIPYGITVESLISEIGEAAEEINGIVDVHDETNKNGVRIVVEVESNVTPHYIIEELYRKTDLQLSFSYNQVALVGKTPTELNLQDCCKIYVDHNNTCIVREAMFDIDKATKRLHIIVGLIKALDVIDNIIAMIKKSPSAAVAKETLMSQWGFSEMQAKAILDMKLSRLAKLEKEELETEQKELTELIEKLKEICLHPTEELQKRLAKIVEKYGDDRRTELVQINTKKEDKEIINVEPEKVVVIMTDSGLIKRIPASSFRTQRRGGKGVKTTDDIVSAVIRTNTIDSLMVFTNEGNMYRLIVNEIPEGTNTTKGTPIKTLISMRANEQATVIYSIYRDTDAKYVLFTTKNGLVKKTSLEEYTKTKKKTGLAAITIKEGDALANVSLIKDEPIILVTKNGMCIKFDSNEISPTSRTTSGVKGINLNKEDEVVSTLVVKNSDDYLGIFSTSGTGKKLAPNELVMQRRGGKGIICFKNANDSVAAAALINDSDNLLILGLSKSICICASDVPLFGRTAAGNIILKDRIQSVSKV